MSDKSGIEISVRTRYLEKQSDPLLNSYAFSYTVEIHNHRAEPVRLLRRHWIITDENNHVEEVKGEGVVGLKPLIQPGESFEYTSGTVLETEVGDMKGSYTMETDSGEIFDAEIPLFVLALPHMVH